jgi:hypothetical protein
LNIGSNYNYYIIEINKNGLKYIRKHIGLMAFSPACNGQIIDFIDNVQSGEYLGILEGIQCIYKPERKESCIGTIASPSTDLNIQNLDEFFKK